MINGPFVYVNDVQEPKSFAQWTADESRRAQYDLRARNIIYLP